MTVPVVPSLEPSSPPTHRATQEHTTRSKMVQRHQRSSSCKRDSGSNLPYPDKLTLPSLATPPFYQTKSRMPTGKRRWEERVQRSAQACPASNTWTVTSRAISRISWMRGNRQRTTLAQTNHTKHYSTTNNNNRNSLMHSSWSNNKY